MCKRRHKPLWLALCGRRRHRLPDHGATESRQAGQESPLPACASASAPDPVYGSENKSDKTFVSEQEENIHGSSN